MEFLFGLFGIHFDLIEFLRVVGYLGLFGIVFAETGLFLGFFLPGDSLLFVAGLLAAEGFFSLPVIVVGIFLSAVIGNLVGYEFGRRVGPKIFSREDSLIFKKSHVEKAQSFYEKYGGKTIVFARFVPVVRTFAPILAGVGKMDYRIFFIFNLVGGLLWTLLLVFLGYLLGRVVPDIDRYLLPIVLAIIILSVLPGFIHVYKERRAGKTESK